MTAPAAGGVLATGSARGTVERPTPFERLASDELRIALSPTTAFEELAAEDRVRGPVARTATVLLLYGIVGSTITHAGYHMIGLGLSRSVGGNLSARAAIDEIHTQGGVAIAAHPLREFDGWDDAALAALDGVEATHSVVEEQPEARRFMDAFHARAQSLNADVAAIGSSDMHVTPTLGDHRTILLVRQRTPGGVLEAIRSGLTVGEDPQGRRYGAPAVLRMVENIQPPRRSDANPVARRVAVALAWTGLLRVLLLRN